MTQTIRVAERLVNLGNIFGINVEKLGQRLEAENAFKQGMIFQFSWERGEDAIAAYNEAIKYNKIFWQAWLLRGIVLCQLEQFEEAVTSFTEVIKIQPNDTATLTACNGKGFALSQLGKIQQAIAAYEQALKINPNDRAALTNKNRLLEKK